MYVAFLAKEHPISGMSGGLALGITAATIGIGNALGSLLGNNLRDRHPERVAMLSVLLATVACIATALWYGAWTLGLLGLVQGLTAQLAKLCFDALVQREVPENVRASVFGWSETMLQMLWVLGGAWQDGAPGLNLGDALTLGCSLFSVAHIYVVAKVAPGRDANAVRRSHR